MMHATHQVLRTSQTGLLAPLQRLDCRLQQTIEVTQLLQGTAFQSYCLGSIQPAEQPAEAVVAESPLSQLAHTFGLSPFEIGVVVMAIAPELDRRYERLYACLQKDLLKDQPKDQPKDWPKDLPQTFCADRPLRKPKIALALNLLGGSEAEQRIQQSRFAAQMPLTRLLQPIDHASQGLMQQTLQLRPLVSRYLLGMRSLPSSLAACCQVKWPEMIDHIPPANLPLHRLMVMGFQPSAASLPLSVQFVGCSGDTTATWQSAEGLAAAVSAPLLKVDLTQLMHSVGYSESKSLEAIQQVLLQSQLWKAVLYVESSAELAAYKPISPSISPGVLQKLSVQLATYPGMSVFTDAFTDVFANAFTNTSACLPKETQKPCPDPLLKTHQNQVSFSQAAALKIEQFRLMLMQSFPEFG